MKVKRFTLTDFSMKTFTFSYLPLTVTRLPTYHNRSTCLKSKTTENIVRDKNARNNQKETWIWW